MTKRVLLALLALETLLSVAAALSSCVSCARNAIALAGAAFYLAAFVTTAVLGPRRSVALALFAAFGFHAGLVASGSACALCLASAAGSLAIALLLLRDHAPALVAVPWTAALGLALALAPAPPPPSPPQVVTVYTQKGCPYCEELETRVMPEAIRDLPIEVRYVPAPRSMRATPTIVVGPRVLEGLPPADVLRRAIVEQLTTEARSAHQ